MTAQCSAVDGAGGNGHAIRCAGSTALSGLRGWMAMACYGCAEGSAPGCMETKQRVLPGCRGRPRLHVGVAVALRAAGCGWSFLHAVPDLPQCLQNPIRGLRQPQHGPGVTRAVSCVASYAACRRGHES